MSDSRKTITLAEDLWEAASILATRERKTLQEVVDAALMAYLKQSKQGKPKQ